MRILWVEDNARFVQTAGQAFLRNHELVVVPSLMGAKERLAAEGFDAILLDYDLPDGKGIELFPTLATLGIHPVVIATSSHEMGNNRLREVGAAFICAKKEFGNIEATLQLASDLQHTLQGADDLPDPA
ncbi:MAG: hypothetical protein JWN14_737 [Chthonomonadales bacterium]|nr:hypothetical protein [Chthonomonadales bacterium]